MEIKHDRCVLMDFIQYGNEWKQMPVWNGRKKYLKFLKRSSMIHKIVVCDAKWFVAKRQKQNKQKKTLVRYLNWISRKCTIMIYCILTLWYKITYMITEDIHISHPSFKLISLHRTMSKWHFGKFVPWQSCQLSRKVPHTLIYLQILRLKFN